MIKEQISTTELGRYQQADGPRVIDLSWIEDHTDVILTTHASVYRIRVLDGRRGAVTIRGGKFFPVGTYAFVFGGVPTCGVLKLGRIRVGFALEIVSQGHAVRTGRIQSIEVCPPPAASMSRLPHGARERAGAA